MTHSSKNISCPTCKKEAKWSIENPFRPFCSSRCKLIDLGAWADEKHRIPDTSAPSLDLDEDKSA